MYSAFGVDHGDVVSKSMASALLQGSRASRAARQSAKAKEFGRRAAQEFSRKSYGDTGLGSAAGRKFIKLGRKAKAKAIKLGGR